MPVTKLTVEDSSPWINYTAKWQDSSGGLAGNTPSYSNDSYHDTTSKDAAATITFNGTGCQIFGSSAADHGSYEVIVDGQNSGSRPGQSPDVMYGISLYSDFALPMQQHVITLRNLDDSKHLDLDYVMLQVGDGNPSTSGDDTIMDDTHSNITYNPPLSWVLKRDEGYYNGTYHITGTAKSAAQINFYGNAIALYGATSNDYSSFDISLDGAPPQTYQRNVNKFYPQQLLYYASDLPGGMHTVMLINDFDQTAGTDLDYAVVTVYQNSDMPSSPSGSTQTSPPEMKAQMPTAAIAGAAAGGAALLVLLALVAFLAIRRRRRNRKIDQLYIPNPARPEGEAHTDQATVMHMTQWQSQPAQTHQIQRDSQFGVGAEEHMTEIDMPPPDYDLVSGTAGSISHASLPRVVGERMTETRLPASRKARMYRNG